MKTTPQVTARDTLVLVVSSILAIVGLVAGVILLFQKNWWLTALSLVGAALMAGIAWSKFFGPPDPILLGDES